VIETISVLISSKGEKFTILLLAEDDFRKLLSKFRLIFLHQVKDKKLLNEFKAIHEELKDIKDKRNNAIHSVFTIIGEKDIVRLKLNPRIHLAPFLFEKESIKLEDIENLIDRIVNAKESLSKLNEKIIALSPKKKMVNVLGTLIEK
jgi:hypothetical protein